MTAIEKMQAVGMKALLERVQVHRPGTAIETLYRWRQALAAGKGIRDPNKKLLIDATAGTAAAIVWEDFTPVVAGAAQ